MLVFYNSWDGLIWLLALLAPALFLQRRLHFELQAIFLLITRHENAAIGMFSLLFLPGVLLHELSHFLMARLLGVRYRYAGLSNGYWFKATLPRTSSSADQTMLLSFQPTNAGVQIFKESTRTIANNYFPISASFTANLISNTVANMSDPSAPQDAATKNYADTSTKNILNAAWYCALTNKLKLDGF